jgi:DNA invertase Pin-like site-specific DNA recombinase
LIATLTELKTTTPDARGDAHRLKGKRLGRPPIADKLAERIRAALAGGMSVRKTAAKFDVNPSTVQRVAHPFEGADNASVAGAA